MTRVKILSRNRLNYSNRRFRQEAKDVGVNLSVTDPAECEMFLSPNSPMLMKNGKGIEPADVVMPRIGASINDYALAVITQFEMMGVPVINTSNALFNSKNKLRSIQLMSTTDIAIPKTIFVRRPSELSEGIKRVGGFPVMLKLLSGTQGIGVMLAHNMSSIQSTLDTLWSLGQDILIQECIEESLGRDIRIFVVGDQIVGAMQRQARIGEFRSNIHRGGIGTMIDLTPEYRELALKAAKTIGLEIAGVDMLESNHGPKVIEVNSSPGFEGLEMASGINVAKKILEYCVEKYGK
ncbi:MAG: RimK family alpha-L-glutamate ligase [Bdellovibrionota bacterium]